MSYLVDVYCYQVVDDENHVNSTYKFSFYY